MLTRLVGHHFQQSSFTYFDVFNSEEVAEILALCRALPLTEGDIRTTNDYEPNPEIRRSKVAFFYSEPDTHWIFERLDILIEALNGSYFGYDLFGYDRIQYARYDAVNGGHYNWHSDVGSLSPTRKLSATILLTDDFEGGEFQFNFSNEARPVSTELIAGRLVLFPSYIIHRVRPVTHGVRESLVVWVLGPKLR